MKNHIDLQMMALNTATTPELFEKIAKSSPTAADHEVMKYPANIMKAVVEKNSPYSVYTFSKNDFTCRETYVAYFDGALPITQVCINILGSGLLVTKLRGEMYGDTYEIISKGDKAAQHISNLSFILGNLMSKSGCYVGVGTKEGEIVFASRIRDTTSSNSASAFIQIVRMYSYLFDNMGDKFGTSPATLGRYIVMHSAKIAEHFKNEITYGMDQGSIIFLGVFLMRLDHTIGILRHTASSGGPSRWVFSQMSSYEWERVLSDKPVKNVIVAYLKKANESSVTDEDDDDDAPSELDRFYFNPVNLYYLLKGEI